MIEKYRMSQDHIRRCFRVVRFDNRTVAYCDKQDDAMKLCFQLNRLAALEAVCREIVDSAPQSENELEQMYEVYVNGGLQKEVGHASYGEEVQKFIIAQKLKAVLEEK